MSEMTREELNNKLDVFLKEWNDVWEGQFRDFVWNEIIPRLAEGSRSAGGNLAVCEECGKSYTPVRKDQRFHLTKCKNAWWSRERRRKEREEIS